MPRVGTGPGTGPGPGLRKHAPSKASSACLLTAHGHAHSHIRRYGRLNEQEQEHGMGAGLWPRFSAAHAFCLPVVDPELRIHSLLYFCSPQALCSSVRAELPVGLVDVASLVYRQDGLTVLMLLTPSLMTLHHGAVITLGLPSLGPFSTKPSPCAHPAACQDCLFLPPWLLALSKPRTRNTSGSCQPCN